MKKKAAKSRKAKVALKDLKPKRKVKGGIVVTKTTDASSSTKIYHEP